MEWYRSWPNEPRHAERVRVQGRPYVVDHLPRLRMHSFDYLTVEEWPTTSFCMLEWDIALDRQGKEAFTYFVEESPGKVAAAPYHLSDGREIIGLGCVYFPIDILRRFLSTGRGQQPFTDYWFFQWYGKDRVRIPPRSYDIRPQHLNT